MPYPRLPEALAIAKTKSQTIGIAMPVVPQLRGRLVQIDPDGTSAFNNEMQRFVEDLVVKISQGLTESPRKES